jgi:hypothetical protein
MWKSVRRFVVVVGKEILALLADIAFKILHPKRVVAESKN